MRACISSLPEPYREVFVLSASADLEGAEIALILGVPVNTVWTRLHRARQLFKTRWDPEGDGPRVPAARSGFDGAALWAWLVAWLPPELLHLAECEARLRARLVSRVTNPPEKFRSG